MLEASITNDEARLTALDSDFEIIADALKAYRHSYYGVVLDCVLQRAEQLEEAIRKEMSIVYE